MKYLSIVTMIVIGGMACECAYAAGGTTSRID